MHISSYPRLSRRAKSPGGKYICAMLFLNVSFPVRYSGMFPIETCRVCFCVVLR